MTATGNDSTTCIDLVWVLNKRRVYLIPGTWKVLGKFLITWVKGNNAVYNPLYHVNGSILEAEEIFLVNINLLAATSILESDLDFFQIETGIMKMLIGPGGQYNCANRLVTYKYQWKILLTHLYK